MRCEVRRARDDDAAALAQLEAEARSHLVEVRGGQRLLDEAPAVSDWGSAFDDAGRAVWVASIDDVIVGYLELRLPAPGGIGHVAQVFVLAEARELGFGDDLLAAAIEATVARGGSAIESFALPGDRETKNLFERAGVTARKIIVSKRLD